MTKERKQEIIAAYGLHEGEWAWIENQRGRCRQISAGTVTDQCNALRIHI